MDPAILIVAVLLAAISPFAMLAVVSPIAYRTIGRWLMLVPLTIAALGVFVIFDTANDDSGFGAVAGLTMIYSGILLGIVMLVAFALFGFVNRTLGKVMTGKQGGRSSPRQSQPETGMQ